MSQPTTLERYVAEPPDGMAASRVLWQDLRDAVPVAPLHLAATDGDADGHDPKKLLLLLVQIDGWTRIKTCTRVGCHPTFADDSPAASRRYCDEHSRLGGSTSR